MLLCASPLADAVLAELQAQCALPIVQRIAREGEVADGLRLLRGVPPGQVREAHEAKANAEAPGVATPGVPLLGDLLIERGAVKRAAFEGALQRYRPAEHGRIGDFMVAQGVITRDALTTAIAEQERLRAEGASTS